MGLPPNGRDIECWFGWLDRHLALLFGKGKYHLEISRTIKHSIFAAVLSASVFLSAILQLIGRQLLLKVVLLCSLERIGKTRIGSEA
ncbi:hypothetical protein CEXT_293611 [Caerostris extrusa]|uniref:Uncharacterized protein n=1 Tax=Caerostris extrusa TaxID=172846 RepID=A0AAV4MWQ3_CAEEX|nr:hypothetical protein CEXT_293611 [Caerostris extrusa]